MNGWVGDLDILHVKSVRYNWHNKARPWWKKLSAMLSPRIHMYLWLEKQRVHLKPPRRTAVVSESLKQQLQHAYETKYPFDVITPGVHLPRLDPAIRIKNRQDLGFSDEDTVAILVARNPLSKGLNTILDALPTLPNCLKLLVVGSPKALENQLKTQLKQQGYELATAFSWENIAKQVESIYVDMIATRLHKASK